MALARTAFALAPLIINARARRPAKRLAGVIIALGLIGLAGVFFIISGFVWIMKTWGAEFGFLAVGVLFFILAGIVYFTSRGHKVKPKDVEAEMSLDPLAKYIPADMQNDPRILALMEKIKEHPMGSTAAAVSLGFIISTQIFGD